jgi:hypothetical protein
MARLVRAIWCGTVLVSDGPDEACPCEGGGRAMTREQRCHDAYITTLAPLGLAPSIMCRHTVTLHTNYDA